MKFVSALKRPAELYLIIVGGGYSLSGLVALILNTHSLLAPSDRIEIGNLRSDLGENWILLIAATAAFIAGVGIYKYRWWGLLLAMILGVLAIGESVAASAMDPWEYHNFTIGLPMAAIMVWAMLPPTWVLFKRKSMKTS